MPLMEELAVIRKRPYNDIIVIDDARLFGQKTDYIDWSEITTEAILKEIPRVDQWYLYEDRLVVINKSCIHC